MKQTECVVIGGGIAGLSLAARLAAHMGVTVLEAESAPGTHASGRSVAFAHFGLGETIVRTLTAASLPEFRAMAGPSGAPIASVMPALHIARADQRDIFDALVAVHERFGCDFSILEGAQIHAALPALTVGPDAAHTAILDKGALKLDTDAMMQTHLAKLRELGGELVTGAQVQAIARNAELWNVHTAQGDYETRLIVNAAGAWADEIAQMAGCAPVGIEPRRRTVISFAGPQGVDVSRWPFVKTVGEGFYMLPEGSARLLASSMDQTPSAPCDAAAEELDMAIAADRIINAADLSIRRIEHSWAGLRSFAPDELPVIGAAANAPGFYWFAGQGGYGFQTAPALARIGEAMVLGTDWPSDIFAANIFSADVFPADIVAADMCKDGVQPGDLSPRRFGA